MEIGVPFAWNVGIRDMVVEIDSKIVVDTLLGLCTPPMVVSNELNGIAYTNFRILDQLKCLV